MRNLLLLPAGLLMLLPWIGRAAGVPVDGSAAVARLLESPPTALETTLVADAKALAPDGVQIARSEKGQLVVSLVMLL